MYAGLDRERTFVTEFNRSAPATPRSAHNMTSQAGNDAEAFSVADPELGRLEVERKSVSRSMMELRDLGQVSDQYAFLFR